MSQAEPLPASDRADGHGARDLTRGPIGRTLVAFALPLLASNILQSLNGSVNTIWVGRYLGEAALTATSNANIVLFFLLGAVFGVGMATTILIAQAVGRADFEGVRRTIGTGMSFFAGLSILMAGIGFVFAGPILAAMGTPAEATPLAIAYMRVIFLALPFMYLSIMLTMALRGMGDATTPFWYMLVAVALDIALNPLLIFGFGPLPGFGIAGSAAATLVSQAVSLAGLLWYMRRSGHALGAAVTDLRALSPDPAILRAMFVKGLPMGLQMVLVSGSAIALISLVNRYGVETTAAYGVATQLWTYVMMPALAIGASVSAMAAQNIGAGRWDRVGRITAWGLGCNLVLTSALVAALAVLGRPVIGLFLPGDASALAVALHINAVVTWSFILFGMTMVLFGTVRATGAVVPPLVILFVALWLGRIPVAASLGGWLGADAIWWSFPVGSVISVVLAAAYYRFGNWRSARMTDAAAGGPPPETGLGSPVAIAAVPER